MFNFVKTLLRYISSGPKPREPLHLLLQPQQVFQDRYRVLECLGQGPESTVWLAEDLATPKRAVALKILTDYATSLQEKHAFELRVMERMSCLPSTTPGVCNLPSLFDYFFAPGVHRRHLCLVTEALGPSVLQVQETEQGWAALPSEMVRHLTRQVLRALEALHDGCRVVHTDIKLDNILFRRSTLASDGSFDPEHAFDRDNIVLIDYSTAMPMEVASDRLIQPLALRSPEVLLGCPWGAPADIWNLGCIVCVVVLKTLKPEISVSPRPQIFELLTARKLFNPQQIANSCSAEQYHLARIYGTLARDFDHDRLRAFFKCGRAYARFFHDDGRLRLAIDSDHRESLQQTLEMHGIYTPELLELLSAMLQVYPADRLSAKQLQALSWVRE